MLIQINKICSIFCSSVHNLKNSHWNVIVNHCLALGPLEWNIENLQKHLYTHTHICVNLKLKTNIIAYKWNFHSHLWFKIDTVCFGYTPKNQMQKQTIPVHVVTCLYLGLTFCKQFSRYVSYSCALVFALVQIHWMPYVRTCTLTAAMRQHYRQTRTYGPVTVTYGIK